MSDQSQSPVSEAADEEDWSTVMKHGTTGFSQHEQHVVHIGDNHRLTLECVSRLCPLDMINLYNGTHDSTGHVVWMGAFLFVEAMAKKALSQELYFRGKRVLELGCGTGIAGITVMLKGEPSFVALTDADSEALDLCRRNCERNVIDKRTNGVSVSYIVSPLHWGAPLDEDNGDQCVHRHPCHRGLSSTGNDKFDTVLATDVLYDIGALEPLLSTASASLLPAGFFILSHVPRASLPNSASVATSERLENHITSVAKSHGLMVKSTIRPSHLYTSLMDATLHAATWTEMADAGAAILIYQKSEM